MTVRCAVLLACSSAVSSTAMADGGTIRAAEERGPWRVTVFTSSPLLRVGPVDMSILVQDSRTGEIAPAVDVFVRTTTLDGMTNMWPATSAAADSPLYRDARFDLMQPGPTTFEVVVRTESHEERVRFEARVSPPHPPAMSLWPWLAAPGVVVLLFLFRESVRRESPLDSPARR